MHNVDGVCCNLPGVSGLWVYFVRTVDTVAEKKVTKRVLLKMEKYTKVNCCTLTSCLLRFIAFSGILVPRNKPQQSGGKVSLLEISIDPRLFSTDCAVSWPLFEARHMTVTTYDFPLSYSSLYPLSWLQFYKANVACQAFLMGCTEAREAWL